MTEIDVGGSRLRRRCLQELLAPVVQTLVAVGRLLGVRLACVLHPFAEQLGVFLQDQVLTEHRVGLQTDAIG